MRGRRGRDGGGGSAWSWKEGGGGVGCLDTSWIRAGCELDGVVRALGLVDVLNRSS